MGSSGKSNFTSTIRDQINPIGWVARETGADWLAWSDLSATMDVGFQSLENTSNWISGKEDFGVHQNWFGNGPVADSLSQMMGGSTEAQRQQIEFDETMAQARQDLELTRQVKMAQAKATNAAKTEPVVKESGSLSALTDDDNTLGNTILT